ncbi:MAG: GspH/FimT family protein [Thiotrichales bacterium]|nr:GspH/FimT family protein [Thiotrichales bacterium]
MNRKHRQLQFGRRHGFTLIELLIVISMIAIIATIAAPALSNAIKSNRLSTENFQFIKAMKYARYQAITGKQTITVTSATGTNNWAAGWNITDQNGNLIRSAIPLGNGSVFSGNNNVSTFSFTRFGFLGNGANLTFTHNDPNATCIGNYSGPITITPNGDITSRPVICDGNNVNS